MNLHEIAGNGSRIRPDLHVFTESVLLTHGLGYTSRDGASGHIEEFWRENGYQFGHWVPSGFGLGSNLPPLLIHIYEDVDYEFGFTEEPRRPPGERSWYIWADHMVTTDLKPVTDKVRYNWPDGRQENLP